MAVDLVSVHVPKCAGTSLLTMLHGIFGARTIYRDNGDRPLDPKSPMNADRAAFLRRMQQTSFAALSGARAIHGHFHVLKYQNLPRRLTIAFLRDPVDRLISHYLFWKQLPRHGHGLHDFFLDNDLSIEQFAALPTIGTLYTSVFFGGVAMEQFDLIGFHDRLEPDCRRLCALLGTEYRQLTRANATPGGDERLRLTDDRERMALLRDRLNDDVAFYERLRERV